MKHRPIVAALIGLCAVITAAAQNLTLISSDDNLSSCLINDLYQDSKGYVWIATEYGLNRSDGTAMTTYYNVPGDSASLRDNYVHAVLEHRPGKLLVGCLKGLLEWDRGTQQFTLIPLAIRGRVVEPHVTRIVRLSSGEIWVGTAGYGIFALSTDGTVAHLDDLPEGLPGEFVSCIYEDATHAVWIGTENHGIIRYYPAGGQSRHFRQPELAGAKVTSIVEDRAHNRIYVGSLDAGVECYDHDSGRFTPLAYTAGGHPLAVRSLALYRGACYAGTEGQGIKEISADGRSLHDLPASSPAAACATGKIHQIMTDRDGNLWVGMYQRGVVVLPAMRYRFMAVGRVTATDNQIGDGCVMALCPDGRGSLWVSCDNQGIYQLDSDYRRLRHIAFPSTVMSMMRDSRGNLWAGTFASGLWCLEAGAQSPRAIAGLAGACIYSIVEDSGGDIYIGYFGKGLYRYEPDTDRLTKITARDDSGSLTNDPADWINNLLVAPDGRVWLAHYGGISCYDPRKGRFESFGGSNTLVDHCLGYALAADRRGRIWCGTSTGLYAYNPADGSLTHRTTADGLPNNVVGGICEDGAGNIWLSTYHGISKYVTAADRFVNFDNGDGLQGNEFTHGAYCSDASGNIYFGGNNGFNAFYPYDIDDSPRQYRPVLTSLEVLSTPVTTRTLSGGRTIIDTELDEAGEVSLAPDDNTISIGFSTLTYNNPDKIVYEYRITEHGPEWLSTQPGQGHVTFSNLSPGCYHLQLRVAGDTAAEGMRTLTIVVRPPWYRSWWAITIYALAALALCWLLVRFARNKARRIRREAEHRQAEALLEAKLQFFTNISHEIRTPLTLVINPLQKLLASCPDPGLRAEYAMIYRNAERILRLVNQIMDIRKIEKGQMAMHMSATDMGEFVDNAMQPFEYLARENDIAFTLHRPEEPVEGYIDVNHFDKVLVNLLSNAFKYTPAGGSIDVSVERGDDPSAPAPLDHYIEIRVSDTGTGIDPDKLEQIFERFYSAERDLAGAASGTGVGLHLSRSLVDLHHGTIKAQNRPDGGGSVFVIRIPAGSAHLSAEELAPATETRAVMPQHDRLPELPPITALPVADAKPRTRQTVVIVEDDTEIRNYIASELASDYRTAAFNNADDALTYILSQQPCDLVISDVMMNGTDGISLCRRVKQNVNTNHIPVVLISALASDQDRVDALSAGADSYITKPFSTRVLRTTMSSLLANRSLLRAKFSGAQEQSGAVESISMKSQDEVLLARVMAVINANISSPTLSVEFLATEVGISRVHLHRKLKELTDLSGRDFIRSIRMKQAARLLRENKYTVAEVAYATGFSTPSHFSSAFKDMYGVTPTAYATQEEIHDA